MSTLVPRALSLTLALGLGLGAAFTLGACKKKNERESCNPDDYVFEEVSVLVQASKDLNIDSNGDPLPTVVRIYQLNGDLATRSLDVAELWTDSATALGDEYISEKEITIFPEGAENIPLTLEKEARFILVAGGFQQPVGNTWFRVYEVPDTFGKQSCDEKRKGNDPGDLGQPCVYLMLERNQIDGGKNVPPGFDKSKIEGTCTPVYTPKTTTSEGGSEGGDDKKKKK
ncbi:MAG: type VI secretion system lipoprotein TssJ [Myxococcales bacterium]|nr:type VI secretion system lipoprotein TssJ [Myxococcales bacterium]